MAERVGGSRDLTKKTTRKKKKEKKKKRSKKKGKAAFVIRSPKEVLFEDVEID